jgi:uncharacterized protein (DUF2336 family)
MRSSPLGEELEVVLAAGNATRRIDILNRVTDLFVLGAERYSADLVGVFDDVMTRLLRGADAMTRARLADRLAPMANAPSDVIRMLASDDAIAVAGPVLALSAQLTERDLLLIAGSKSQSHLLAIARRRTIGASVADALVGRGDSRVLGALAQRSGTERQNHPPPRESEIYRYARDGKLAETAAALSIMSGLPNDAVERALLNPRAEALLVLARAAGLSSVTTEAILRLRAADCGMSEEDLAQALVKFSRLPRDSARRVLNFFRIRLNKPGPVPELAIKP